MLSLRYEAEAIVAYLFAVADGFALQALSDTERDIRRPRRAAASAPLPALARFGLLARARVTPSQTPVARRKAG